RGHQPQGERHQCDGRETLGAPCARTMSRAAEPARTSGDRGAGGFARLSHFSALKESPHEPSCRSQNDARGHGHPPGDIDATELEAHDSVPEKMPDTAAEVQEEDECCYHEQRATNG